MEDIGRSLGAVLLQPHLLPHAPVVIGVLKRLLQCSDARERLAILKASGITKLGLRQEVQCAVGLLANRAAQPPPTPVIGAASSVLPVVIEWPLAFKDALLSPADPAVAGAVALALAEDGFVVCQGGMPAAHLDQAAADARRLHEQGKMHPGRTVPHSDAAYTIPEGYVGSVPVSCWLPQGKDRTDGMAPDDNKPYGLADLDARMRTFGRAVVEALGALPAQETLQHVLPFARADDGGVLEVTNEAELMVSCFDGDGASYAPHVDNTDGDQRADLGRCFTLLYYLNPGWDAQSDGGALRVYLPLPVARRVGQLPGSVATVDVEPTADAMVIFRADKLLHEVRPTCRRRLAVTLWMCAKSEGAPQDERPRARPVPLYPRSEYGRCVQAALEQHPFRPISHAAT